MSENTNDERMPQARKISFHEKLECALMDYHLNDDVGLPDTIIRIEKLFENKYSALSDSKDQWIEFAEYYHFGLSNIDRGKKTMEEHYAEFLSRKQKGNE